MTILPYRYLKRYLEGVFYGWWVVIASMSALVIGSAFYWQGVGVFFLSLQDEFGTSRAVLSGAIALSQLEGGMLGPIGGYLVDRFGPRRMMLIGVTLMGTGYILMSLTTSLFSFLIVFLCVISFGMSIGVRVPATVAPANWFIKRRGLAMGIALSGSGLGGVFIPMLGFLIAATGWRQTAVLTGVAVWILGIPLAMVMRKRPEDYGLMPDGIQVIPQDGSDASARDGETVLRQEDSDFTLMEALKNPIFWLLAIAFGMRQFTIGAVSLHLVPFFVDTGLGLEAASAILAVVTLTSVLGRVGFGFLADIFQPRYVMAFSMAMVGLGTVVLMRTPENYMVLIVFILIYGVGWGGGATTMNATRAAYFGRKSFGTVSGTMDFFQIFGLVLGPIYAGFIFDVTQSYSIAFASFALSATLAGVVMFFLKPPKKADGL